MSERVLLSGRPQNLMTILVMDAIIAVIVILGFQLWKRARGSNQNGG